MSSNENMLEEELDTSFKNPSNLNYISYDDTNDQEYIICNADIEPTDFLKENMPSQIDPTTDKINVIDVNPDENKSSLHLNADENKPEQKKRGMPKSMLEKQQKYNEMRDKQLRLLENMKKAGNKQSGQSTQLKTVKTNKQSNDKINSDSNATSNSNSVATSSENVIRINIGGKVRYVNQSETVNLKPPSNTKNDNKNLTTRKTAGTENTGASRDRCLTNSSVACANSCRIRSTTGVAGSTDSTDSTDSKSKTKASVQNTSHELMSRTSTYTQNVQKSSQNDAHTARLQNNNMSKSQNSNSTSGSNKIPDRYAKEIEKNVKVTASKNVKTFSDLRRVKMLDNLDTTTDANTTSMNELRRLKMESRKKDLEELKKKTNVSPKESAVQQIMNDEKMTKFAKTMAIKNLSTSSRTKIKQSRMPTPAQTIANKKISAEAP